METAGNVLICQRRTFSLDVLEYDVADGHFVCDSIVLWLSSPVGIKLLLENAAAFVAK